LNASLLVEEDVEVVEEVVDKADDAAAGGGTTNRRGLKESRLRNDKPPLLREDGWYGAYDDNNDADVVCMDPRVYPALNPPKHDDEGSILFTW